MSVLFDTDAFCKLGGADLLEATAELFGCRLVDCARLPALPYMLKRGRLRRRFGDTACDALLPVATAMPEAPAASAVSLDLLRGVPDVDPGEAQLLALVAERGDYLVTGDKRALRSVTFLPAFPQRLAGKVVLPEALLHELCCRKGEAFVRTRVSTVLEVDTMLQVCFSAGNPDAKTALKAYVEESRRELRVLALWTGSE